jgi:hypothetical protein
VLIRARFFFGCDISQQERKDHQKLSFQYFFSFYKAVGSRADVHPVKHNSPSTPRTVNSVDVFLFIILRWSPVKLRQTLNTCMKRKTKHLKKLSPDQTRTERIEILVTPPEKMLIEEALDKLKSSFTKSSLAAFVRQSTLYNAERLVGRRIAT